MILQIITPQQETFNLPVSLPKDYLGKQVHCLFYIEEEAKTISVTTPTKKSPSDFFGILTKTEGEKFQQHIEQIRGEWDRSI
jgi:hypothetical protein